MLPRQSGEILTVDTNCARVDLKQAEENKYERALATCRN